MARSVTSWFRIEPQSDDLVPGPDRALAARIFDPAWMLGRQWQLGELTGEDAASAAWVRLRLAAAPMTRLQLAGPDEPVRTLGGGDLLEPLVEAEADQEEGWAESLAAGAHFLEALEHAGLGSLVPAFRASYPLPEPDGSAPGRAARRRHRVLRVSGLDGFELRRAARGSDGQPRLPDRPDVPQGQQEPLLGVLRRWLEWYPEPADGAGGAWVPERMEYRFAVAGPHPTDAGELVLEAPAYQGGRLDWDELRAAPAERSLGAGSDADRERWTHSSLPARVGYPGMPANRWWEFEDAAVSYGHVEAEGGDVARLLMIEFGTVYGNDWFLAPCDVPFGNVLGVEALVVTDTFGRATLVTPAAEVGWDMFSVSGTGRGLLVLPEVVAGFLEGPAVEEVQLSRDEAANTAWAIERLVSGATGERVDRHEEWSDRLARERGVAAPVELPPETVTYTLANDPPDDWIPLVPRSDGHRSIRLHRGEVVHGDGRAFPPLGKLLEPGRPLALFEEEVPRGGLLVARAWQLARTAGGSTATWVGRRIRPARGDSRSGLAYDRLHAPDGAGD